MTEHTQKRKGKPSIDDIVIHDPTVAESVDGTSKLYSCLENACKRAQSSNPDKNGGRGVALNDLLRSGDPEASVDINAFYDAVTDLAKEMERYTEQLSVSNKRAERMDDYTITHVDSLLGAATRLLGFKHYDVKGYIGMADSALGGLYADLRCSLPDVKAELKKASAKLRLLEKLVTTCSNDLSLQHKHASDLLVYASEPLEVTLKKMGLDPDPVQGTKKASKDPPYSSDVLELSDVLEPIPDDYVEPAQPKRQYNPTDTQPIPVSALADLPKIEAQKDPNVEPYFRFMKWNWKKERLPEGLSAEDIFGQRAVLDPSLEGEIHEYHAFMRDRAAKMAELGRKHKVYLAKQINDARRYAAPNSSWNDSSVLVYGPADNPSIMIST
ncbi:hypothetical protein JW826_00970 [Candidatus Woesearchaeota archaeon]|nr:hypothetical protein [Candidatus Woesearchaeota archaeon]